MDEWVKRTEEMLQGYLKTLGLDNADTTALYFLEKDGLHGITFFGDITMGNFIAGQDHFGLPTPAILDIMTQNKKSGILTFEIGGLTKLIIFRQGNIVSAGSSSYDERIGEWFLAKGKINEDQLNLAIDQQKINGKKLGRILVDFNFLKPKDLFAGSKDRVMDIILDLFKYKEGKFFLVEGKIDWKNKVAEVPVISVQNIAMEAAKREDEAKAIRDKKFDNFIKAIALAGTSLRKNPKSLINKLSDPIQQKVFSLFLDGRAKETKEIYPSTDLPEIQVDQILFEFLEASLIEIRKALAGNEKILK